MKKKSNASSQNPFSESGTSPGVLSPSEILTIEEVAQRLKVKPRWVYEKTRHRCQDPLPCTHIGRYLRFYWPEISAWFQRHSNAERAL